MQINMEYIKAQLQRRLAERQLAKVARMSGIGLRTLRRIVDGGTCRMGTAQELQDFLTRHERVKTLDEHEAEE